MAQTKNKYQIIQKVSDQDTILLHPETEAGIVEYDNSQSGLSATTVQGAIDEISQAASGLGTPVDIMSDHRSFNNAYVFPSDGYITFQAQLDDNIDVRVYGSNATTAADPYIRLYISPMQLGQGSFYEDQALYVRKGMKAYVALGYKAVNFIPLI